MNRDNPNAWLAFAGWLFVLFIIWIWLITSFLF